MVPKGAISYLAFNIGLYDASNLDLPEKCASDCFWTPSGVVRINLVLFHIVVLSHTAAVDS